MKHTSSSKLAASLLAAVLLSGAFASPASAEEPGAADSATATETSAFPAWLSVKGILGVSLGQSLFQEDPPVREDIALERTSYWSVSYLVVPEATFGDFDLSLGLMLEQRMSDNPDDETDFGLGETLFNVRWQGYELEEIGLSFSPTSTVVFPTSELAGDSTLLFGTELALDVRQRLFDIVEIAVNVGWRKNVHSEQTRSFKPSIDGDSVISARGYPPVVRGFYPTFYRGGASLSRPEFDGGAVNTSSVLHLGPGLEVNLPADLGVAVGYSLYSRFLYDMGADDEYAPPGVSTEPRLDKVGVATIDLRYSPLAWLSIGAGTATTQPTHTPDNRSLRFPFWDFSDDYLSADASTIRLYAIGRY